MAAVFMATSAKAQDAGSMPPQAEARAAPPSVSAGAPSAGAVPPRVAAQPGHAPATEAPSNGVAALVTGGIFTGLGAVNLATAVPVCSVYFKNDASRKSLCTEVALGVAGGTTGVGLIILIIGGTQRSIYNDWKRTNALESHLVIVPGPGGATAGFKGSF